MRLGTTGAVLASWLVVAPRRSGPSVGCNRGAAAPNTHTRLRLFADSGGYCQDPTCHRALFEDTEDENIHLAEMAHIFAASDTGPRACGDMTEEERGAYENLILLCSNCHTRIDKAPNAYPDSRILTWKREHKERIANLFGATEYRSRELAYAAIEPLLHENRTIFELYGPETDERYNPEGEMPVHWKRKILSRILPNNRRLLSMIDANKRHLQGKERALVERFRQHVNDFEAKHLGPPDAPSGLRFPVDMHELFKVST
jgi:hypothetical protein